MSKTPPPRSRAVKEKRRFAIVASQFNARYVDGLVSHAAAELRSLCASEVTLHRVPGAFEIPIVVREIAAQKKTDAIIAAGVILQGETDHAEHLARSVTDALQRIALELGVPVINAVLSFGDEAQARERCLKSKINRGTEAGRAAVEIVNALAKVRAT